MYDNLTCCHSCNAVINDPATARCVEKMDGERLYFCDDVCEMHYRLVFGDFKKWFYKYITDNFITTETE